MATTGRPRARETERLVPKFTEAACGRCGALNRVVSGAWLRCRREQAGVTLREMAARLGHSAPYLCDIEKNRRNCLPRVLAAYEAL